MLRIKIVVALAAMAVMLMSFAAPAMAAELPIGRLSDSSTELFSSLSFCDLNPEACALSEAPVTLIPDPNPELLLEEQSLL